MSTRKSKKKITPDHKQPDSDPATTPEKLKAAHDNAEKDIRKDPEFSAHSPNDDLDEGETARLGEDKTDLV